jgi:MFS transporter, NNP family, nitrate/nitrite transporter
MTDVNSMPVEAPPNQAKMALVMSTITFSVCFACWVVNAVLISYLIQQNLFEFSGDQVGWLLALPILTGAISRVPLGMMADQYGGRIITLALTLFCAVPMYLLGHANSYVEFIWCSLGFGLTGGCFAVGIGYVAVWFKTEKQGTALGVFGMGNAGAAITTLIAPLMLDWLTQDGTQVENWRQLPKIYAGALVLSGTLFFILTKERRSPGKRKTFSEKLAPFRYPAVWRFGSYYALCFGGFVAVSQWIIPYSINVYQISLAQAGLIATIFSLPSGVIRAFGGWLSDRYGSPVLMYRVFLVTSLVCVIMAIPKMDVTSSGIGVSNGKPGFVKAVNKEFIEVDGQNYHLSPAPARTPAEIDRGKDDKYFPVITRWHEAVVAEGEEVSAKQLLARGVTNIYYPANIWIFVALVFILGIATGVGKAGVFKCIPGKFPEEVGSVGGIVGLIGALGGFFLPAIFGYLLELTGLWSSCWVILALLSVSCLVWLHITLRNLINAEAPELVRLIESSAARPIPASSKKTVESDVETLLQKIPFFQELSPEKLHSLAAIGEFKTFKAGETIFRKGDPGDALYLVVYGKVRVYLPGEDDKDADLAIFEAGGYFGDLALIDGKDRSASASAVEDSQFILIGRTDFLTLMADSTRVLAGILFGLSDHIRNTNQRYVDLNEKKEKIKFQAEINRHQSIAEMVAGVAHEINTPLGVVNHAASIITDHINANNLEDLAKNEDAEETLEGVAQAALLIEKNIKRADKLVAAFKNLSVRQITESRESVDLIRVVEEMLQLYSLKAEAAKLEVEFLPQLKPSGALWDGYPGQLTQVVMNLLTNIDRYAYGPEGGKVTIRLFARGDNINLEIEDYGAGIPAENRDKVFDAFYTTGRNKGGTGIGLSIVHNLVTFQLDGSIKLTSEEGKGTKFSISFPREVKEKNESTHLVRGSEQ